MINIAANVRAIDTIKSEILSEVSNLYRTLALYDSDAVYDEVSGEIATIIAMDYILARRLGLSYEAIDDKISQFLAMAVENGHELEEEFGDMSELSKNVRGR